MKFQNDLYHKVYSEHKLEKANDESKKDLVKRVYDFGKNIAINYNPFIGYLPVQKQNDLKDKKRKTFGSLDVQVATLASAIGLGLGAYIIGQNLNGFDMGFEMMQKIQFSWTEIGEMPKYVSFPFIWGGFSKTVTDIVSYYIIAESAIRTGAGLLGKPLGGLIGEAAYYATGKLSKRSKAMKQREEDLLRDEKQLDNAKDFTESQRKKYEDSIANMTKEIFEAQSSGDLEKEKHLKLELESLLNKVGTC